MARPEQTKLTPREWLISAVLHLIVFGLLIWFTPAGQLLEAAAKKNSQPPPQQQAMQDPTQVSEVVKEIDKDQEQKARESVADLMQINQTLDQMSRDRVKDYNKAAQENEKSAKQQALDLLQKIPQDQDAALSGQKQLAEKAKSLLGVNATTPTEDSMKELQQQLGALQNPVAKDQLATQDTQAKGLQMVHFTGQDSAAAKAQQNANDLETAAYDAQQAANKVAASMVGNLETQRWQSGNEKRMEDAAAADQAQVDAAKQPIPADQQADDAAKAKADAALQAAKDARDFANKNKGADNFAKADALNRDRATAERELNDANRRLKQDQQKLDYLQRGQQGKLDQAKHWQDAVNDDKTKLAAQEPQLQSALDDAAKKQQDAKQAQVDALTKIAATSPDANAALAEIPAAAAPEDPSTLDGKDLSQLVDKAKEIEEKITDKYQTDRAATFAEMQKLTMADALKATQVAKPHHDDLDKALLATQGAVKNFAAYKQEVFKANQQIQSIVSTGESMLETAESDAQMGQGDDAAQAAQKYEKQFAAAEDGEGSDARDLTGLMGEGPDDGAHNGEGDGEESGKKGAKKGGVGFESEEKGLGINVKVYPRTAPEVPNMHYADLKPIPAHIYREAGGAHYADWFYVDGWYLIGPFPDEGRENLNTKFAPESVVDLDATYPGKNGQPVKWVYHQWPLPPMNPPNDVRDAPAIYYGYTELTFEHPEDLWVATGSDDKGTMWINGVMVWNSGDTLKWWAPDEGYRRVHFREGRNKILYRLENGQLTAIFSLMISAKKD